MNDFTGKTAVITGAASGIGQAVALKCADQGMNLVLSDIDETNLAGTLASAEAKGVKAITVRTDVSNSDSVMALANKAFETFGAVHLLFNNAGVMANGMTWEHDLKDWQWLLGVNLFGVIHGIHAFVPRMIAQDEPARVINTASIAGFLDAPVNGLYGVSKHAVVSLSETLHYELEMTQSKVRASVLCPGPVKTAIVDADRNRPAELAVEVDDPQGVEDFKKYVRDGIEANGMSPAELADIIFDRIEKDMFWIFPHPEFKDQYKNVVQSVLDETNPVFVPMVDF